jgi:hypothetical protein
VRSLLVVVSILFLLATPSWAALGQSVASLGSDQRRLHGALRTTVSDGFSIHEITGEDGTIVRQYASPSGAIFAVSWNGPFVPDLEQLLGAYFQEYRQALRSTARHRGPLVLRTSRLVLETSGHMRSFHGRAYLPAMLPVAVSAEALR